MFELHPQLKADCIALKHLALCEMLLMNDARYPWFILVPRRPGLREIFELDPQDQRLLIEESSALARALVKIFKPDKMNIAALGNIVPQLHIHHIVRFQDDPAWPLPVWGKFPPRPYTEIELNVLKARIAYL